MNKTHTSNITGARSQTNRPNPLTLYPLTVTLKLKKQTLENVTILL